MTALSKTPPIVALRDHAATCRICSAAKEARLPLGFLCPAGLVLGRCALGEMRRRGRRGR